MEKVIISLLPLIVGAAVLPLWIVMTLLLLRGKGGMFKASAFATGAMTVRMLQGLLFGYVFASATDAGDDSSDLIASTLLLVVGLLLLITAIKAWWKEGDPDAPPPRWMTRFGGISVSGSFGMGALMMAIAVKQWVFTLSAIAIIDEAKLGLKASVFAYLFFVVAAQSLVLAPIISSAVTPKQSAKLLEVMEGWLERHNRAITIAGSLIFGVWFLVKGTTGLMVHGGETVIINHPTTE